MFGAPPQVAEHLREVAQRPFAPPSVEARGGALRVASIGSTRVVLCASAMMRTAEAAMLASPLGSVLVTLGAAGQMISTAGGLAAGWISSTRSVSPLGVIWPAANSMRDDVDTAGPLPVEVPVRVRTAGRDRLMWTECRFHKSDT